MPEDWSSYNNALVDEVSYFFTKDLLESFKKFDVESKGKVGRPPYPNSLIILLAIIRAYFKLPYRQTEGLAKMLLGKLEIKVPDYSTIDRRIGKLNIPVDIDRSAKAYELAIDSTGFKVTNRGEWLRQKWAVKRGWIKLHIAVDVKTKKIISLEVTDESVGDSREFKPLVDDASQKGKITKVYADSAYDSMANFNLLNSLNAEAAIKPRKNSSRRSKGSYLRVRTVRAFLSDPEKWKDSVSYGLRWIVEACNSTMKRTLGEYVAAIDPIQMVQEMKVKCLTYNILTGWRSA